MADVVCPECGTTFEVEPSAHIPDEQTMTMTMSFESPLASAMSIGKALVSLEEVQRSVAKSMGYKVAVFIKELKIQTGEVTITTLIARVK